MCIVKGLSAAKSGHPSCPASYPPLCVSYVHSHTCSSLPPPPTSRSFFDIYTNFLHEKHKGTSVNWCKLNHVAARRTPQKGRWTWQPYHLCGTTTVLSVYSISSPIWPQSHWKSLFGKLGVTDSVSVPTTLKKWLGDLSVHSHPQAGNTITFIAKHSHRRASRERRNTAKLEGGTLSKNGNEACCSHWETLKLCV